MPGSSPGGLPTALTAAVVVMAVASAVLALAAVGALLVLARLARSLAATEASLRAVLEEAEREAAATMEALRGAATEVQELAGTARSLGRELPLALALGWIGTRARGWPAALAGLAGALSSLALLLRRPPHTRRPRGDRATADSRRPLRLHRGLRPAGRRTSPASSPDTAGAAPPEHYRPSAPPAPPSPAPTQE